MARRVTGLIKGAALLACGVAVSLCLGEAVIRASYPLLSNYNLEMWRYFALFKEPLGNSKLPFVHYPNTEADLYGVHVKTNSMGFRDYEYPVQKPSGKTRIVMLGDSFVFGWGVPFDLTMAKLTEKALNGNGERYEVINMGVGNYNSVMEVELFKRQGLALNPDLVVLVYFVNDVEPVPQAPRAGFALKRNSYLLAFLFDTYVKLRPLFDRGYRWEDYYTSLYQEGSPGIQASHDAIQELARLCQQHGIQVLLISYPELHQLSQYPFDAATQHVQGIANECGLPFLDLWGYFVGHVPKSLWVSAEDTHGNAMASRIAALGITKAIRATGIGGNQDEGAALSNDAPPVRMANDFVEGELDLAQAWRNPFFLRNRMGFSTLSSKAFPGRNLFTVCGGNFEHVFNGALADEWRNWFTPAIDDCFLRKDSDVSASLVWPGERASWPMDSRMTYALSGSGVDLDFSVTFRNTDCFPHGYVAMMWASYVACQAKRSINFWGAQYGWDAGWIEGGREWPGMKTFIYPCAGTPDLQYDEGVNALNIASDTQACFLLPFYYGHFDGDGDPSTSNDDMAYIVMFDQAEPIRFQNCLFHPDPGKSAWDWQYVVRDPQKDTPYGYRARILYKPFISQEDVLDEYVRWVKGRHGAPVCHLEVRVSPDEGGTVFPAQTPGLYGKGARVYLGVLNHPGWVFDHWEGNVTPSPFNFTEIVMNQNESVTAVCKRPDLSPAWRHEPATWQSIWTEGFDEGRVTYCLPEKAWRVVQDGPNFLLEGSTEDSESGVEITGSSRADFRFAARVNLLDGTGRIWFHRTRAKKYALVLGRHFTFLYSQEEDLDGVKLAMADPVPRGVWCDVAIASIGDEVKIYLDGRLAMSCTDPHMPHEGHIAVEACMGSRIRIDDLRLEIPVFGQPTT